MESNEQNWLLHWLMLHVAPPPIALMWMSGSFVITGALRAAARLRVADAIELNSKMNITSLAIQTGTQPDRLHRLMLALQTIGIFSLNGQLWEHTPMSEYLRGDHPNSMRPAILMLGEEQYISYSRLDYSITTGNSAFELQYGSPFWEYQQSNKGSNLVFQGAMTSLSYLVDRAIAIDYPHFYKFRSIVDVAGGGGALLTEVMQVHTHLNGILFELPPVIQLIKSKFAQWPIVNRTNLVSGDFFETDSIPRLPHPTIYVLKQVLHTFGDTEAALILKNVQLAMKASDVILIAERSMTRAQSFIHSQGAAFVDLLMMNNFHNARERYDQEWYQLANSCGLLVTRKWPTRSSFSLFEAHAIDKHQHSFGLNIPSFS